MGRYYVLTPQPFKRNDGGGMGRGTDSDSSTRFPMPSQPFWGSKDHFSPGGSPGESFSWGYRLAAAAAAPLHFAEGQHGTLPATQAWVASNNLNTLKEDLVGVRLIVLENSLSTCCMGNLDEGTASQFTVHQLYCAMLTPAWPRDLQSTLGRDYTMYPHGVQLVWGLDFWIMREKHKSSHPI